MDVKLRFNPLDLLEAISLPLSLYVPSGVTSCKIIKQNGDYFLFYSLRLASKTDED